MKVVVHADSWHYRYWKWLQDPTRFMDRWEAPSETQLRNRAKEPKGLCGYFWVIALSPLMLFGATFLALVFGVVAAVVGVVYGACWLAQKCWHPIRRREHVGLIATYAAARKSSVCPLIEVKR